MIDFSKPVANSSKFQTPSLHYKQYGVYTFHPSGTTEYIKYWDEEARRCLEGYIAEDGDWISGYNYFYLNYCPILRLVEVEFKDKFGNIKKRREKQREFADFYDYDYYYFSAVDEAEVEGKHMVVLKARGKGYSFKGASMLARNFYLIPESKSYALASESEYLTKDGLLTKAWDLMDFIDEHTAWAKKRQAVDRNIHKRASIITTDERGNKIEVGYKSEIIGVTLKNDPNKARGKRGKLILWEEAGSFKDILQAWQIARPSVEEDGVAFGLCIAFGTGGDESSSFDGLKEMFYKPSGYNVKEFNNIWDEHADGTTCGFFVPAYANMSVTDETGKRKYMDTSGNTMRTDALEYMQFERQKVIDGASDTRAVDRYIAENPATPAEACLELTGNIFPKKELQAQLSKIRVNRKLQSHKQVGDLTWVGGVLNWSIKKSGDILKFPLSKDDNPTGSIVIWEHPTKDASAGLYIAGCDPYDHDKAGTNSLGSVFIYKRFQNFEEYYDVLVAEYTGRPATAEDYYENVRKLLTYYNARLLYENERKGIFVYFTNKHCDYLLADQPDIINDIIKNSSVARKKGIHMNTAIKDYGEGLIKEWLNEEYATGKKNLEKILSEPLLEELINYNDKGNFDRVIALMMIMLYRLQLHNLHVKKVESHTRNKSLFESPLFGENYYNKTNTYGIDNVPVYTFN
jgi:hypothetical protein